MARIIYDLASRSKGWYHVYTDLDFWDARAVLRGLARVKRNFGKSPPGDLFPTQVVVEDLSHEVKTGIERRLKRAIPSPPRHLIVQSIIFSGKYEFDRRKYYPDRWSPAKALFFTRKRLPMNQPVINSPYKWVELSIQGNTVTIQQRRGAPPEKAQGGSQGDKSASYGPSCF
ncbi:MAG: hypothetical protein JSU72_18775 [Deltaproteobacteria bacterium]|nr:MAG: hypothetical protein JSU72_18775 [Deltaproteobacteria bacterium]